MAGRIAMHACQIGPTDTAPSCPGSPLRAYVETKGGTLWDRQLSAPISPLLLKCADGATTLSFSFGINQDLRISGLDGKLAAGCLRSRPAWIVFCFHCWVADAKWGRWRDLALGAGWQWLCAAPALSSSCGALSERQKQPPGSILLRFSA